jgi:dipeptidyl aminopeptidase/acylaminoacyl peptidase
VRYVAIPRVTALRLSPDGSWLAAAVQTLTPDRKTYATSIWRIPAAAAGAGGPVRLTRSPDGENNPRFLPDGSLLFVSQRPGQQASDPDRSGGPDGPGGQPGGQAGGQAGGQPGGRPSLWLLPAAGGEAVGVADRPGGVNALETSERTGVIVIASAVMPEAGAGTNGADAAGVSGDGASADAALAHHVLGEPWRRPDLL